MYVTNVQTVQQMDLHTNIHCHKRKCTGQEHRWKQAGLLCSPSSFLFQQHMGAKWGQCALHILARSHRPFSCPLTEETHTHKHTPDWITSLGLEMKRREMPASTDALRSCSGEASAFPLSLWKPWFLCAVVLHVWLRNALPFWQVLFICKCWSERAWIWSQEPLGQGLEV